MQKYKKTVLIFTAPGRLNGKSYLYLKNVISENKPVNISCSYKQL